VGSGDQSQTDDCGLERRERDRTAADAEEHDEEKNDRWYPSKHIDHDARHRSNHERERRPETSTTPSSAPTVKQVAVTSSVTGAAAKIRPTCSINDRESRRGRFECDPPGGC